MEKESSEHHLAAQECISQNDIPELDRTKKNCSVGQFHDQRKRRSWLCLTNAENCRNMLIACRVMHQEAPDKSPRISVQSSNRHPRDMMSVATSCRAVSHRFERPQSLAQPSIHWALGSLGAYFDRKSQIWVSSPSCDMNPRVSIQPFCSP